MDDYNATAIIFVTLLFGLFAGLIIGSNVEQSNSFGKDYQRGERAGIQLCIQNPKVCKVKYDYWNLKGNADEN